MTSIRVPKSRDRIRNRSFCILEDNLLREFRLATENFQFCALLFFPELCHIFTRGRKACPAGRQGSHKGFLRAFDSVLNASMKFAIQFFQTDPLVPCVLSLHLFVPMEKFYR